MYSFFKSNALNSFNKIAAVRLYTLKNILIMNNTNIKTLKFSINGWSHLYSLQQAIQHNHQHTGRTLSINGRIIGNAFLNQQDSDISICFSQSDITPKYTAITETMLELASIKLSKKIMHTEVVVDKQVFEELRKNLMEYADIDGIHIIVTLGVLSDDTTWKDEASLSLVQLDYAMKGDA